MKKLAYYITAHGYGHGTRSFDIINAISEAAPEVSIVVKTDLPPEFVANRLKYNYQLVPGAFDVGLIQKDSIRIDMDASFEAVTNFYKQTDLLIEQETEFIRSEGVGAVIADIPAIPLAAAKRTGVPSIAAGNFGWDWIYSEFLEQEPGWQHIIDFFRETYEQTDLLLRLPFAEPMDAFPNPVDIPLLARPGTSSRELIARLTNADIRKTWVLLSFTTLDLNSRALEQITSLEDYLFFSVDPLEWKDSGIQRISRTRVPFADILASMDVVVTKPGFGIVSECMVNRKPIIHADREHFREYPILIEHIERYCRHAPIPADALYAGDLGPALKTIENAVQPEEQMPMGGAAIAAREILSRLV